MWETRRSRRSAEDCNSEGVSNPIPCTAADVLVLLLNKFQVLHPDEGEGVYELSRSSPPRSSAYSAHSAYSAYSASPHI